MPPMTRRRSARLASSSKSVQGATASQTLVSLPERDEEEVAAALSSPSLVPPSTPVSSSPVKPSMSEMRPSKLPTAPPVPSSALRLGFVDIPSSARRDSTIKASKKSKKGPIDGDGGNGSHSSALDPETTAAFLQATPSKIAKISLASPSKTASVPPASAFTFQMPRSGFGGDSGKDMGLTDDAQRMMEEIREKAQKIHAELREQRDREREQAQKEEALNGRRIAQPKSRASRFSAAHTAQFDKMDSIENHPSAFRMTLNRTTPAKVAPAKATPTKATPTMATPTKTTAAFPLGAGAAPAVSGLPRGLKRTQSKANLDEAASNSSTTHTKPAKTPVAATASGKKPTVTFADSLDFTPIGSARKGNILFADAHMSTVKRLKQRFEDDASTSRPVSRDGSSLPRPAQVAVSTTVSKSSQEGSKNNNGGGSLVRSQTTGALLSPTKSTLAKATGTKAAETHGSSSVTEAPKTPSKMSRLPGLAKSASISNLHAAGPTGTATTATANVSKPLQPVAGPTVRAVNPSLPGSFNFSKTPAPARAIMPLPRFPATTPRRKLVKHVAFTPGTQRAILAESSPSLLKSSIPRSAFKPVLRGIPTAEEDAPDPASPSIKRVRFGGGGHGATVMYPDLSGHYLLKGAADDGEEDTPETKTPTKRTLATKDLLAPASVPGTFTFRSDKTISFGGKSPAGFGSSPGQASLRKVRSSSSGGTAAAVPKIPGSFPEASLTTAALVATDGPNKENTRPVVANYPHGITNKKRHRISEAEEEAEQEAADRAAKKRKNALPVPEGEALLAPRLVASGANVRNSPRATPRSTPMKRLPGGIGSKTPGSAVASARKRPVLSLSRLNSLAQPKLRK